MDHEAMQEKVFQLHDGELSPAEQAEARRHLEACASCRADLDAWKKTAVVFFPAARAQASEEFVERVMARIEEPGVWARTASRLRAAASFPRFALAGAAAAAVLAVVVLRPAAPPVPPAETSASLQYAADLIEASYAEAGEEPLVETDIETYFL
ncbi:MAG: anti-sigma factor family protein [Elusimicrobiota bacterium]